MYGGNVELTSNSDIYQVYMCLFLPEGQIIKEPAVIESQVVAEINIE
jgi:hypothetical protein